jgi:predicted nuclease of predicted toxin-antitoxin system
MLLALRRGESPSVIHLRHVAELGPDEHVKLLLANLPTITDDLERGVVASLSPTRLAIRDLPIR